MKSLCMIPDVLLVLCLLDMFECTMSPLSRCWAQERSVRVKHDAQMHHSQNRGSKKTSICGKKGEMYINFAKSLEKFMNDVEIGGNMQYASFS